MPISIDYSKLDTNLTQMIFVKKEIKELEEKIIRMKKILEGIKQRSLHDLKILKIQESNENLDEFSLELAQLIEKELFSD